VRHQLLFESADGAGIDELTDALHARSVEVREMETGVVISAGMVNVGKHLRPNYREHRIVRFVERDESSDVWNAIRLL